jgi:Rv2258c-like winged HTH domain
MDLDHDKLNAFLGRAVVDIGATLHAGLVVIGEKLGLYKALAAAEGPLTPAELAQRTETTERYVREWLNAQAAGGYVTYHADSGRYSLTPEQAFTLADQDSPAYLPGAFQLVTAAVKSEPRIAEAFRSGAGFGWHEHDHGLFEGTERFFRPN